MSGRYLVVFHDSDDLRILYRGDDFKTACGYAWSVCGVNKLVGGYADVIDLEKNKVIDPDEWK